VVGKAGFEPATSASRNRFWQSYDKSEILETALSRRQGRPSRQCPRVEWFGFLGPPTERRPQAYAATSPASGIGRIPAASRAVST
jgi:hypothetical protein